MKLNNKIATLYGPNPRITKWIYTGIVRAKIAYASIAWTHSIKTKKIEQQFEKLNRLICMIITPTRKSISHKSLEVIYNILPLKLHLEQAAISTYLRLKNILFTPASTKYSYLKHWETQINELGIITPDIDNTTALNFHKKNQGKHRHLWSRI